MADGSVITFSYTKQDVYTLDLVNIKEQNNNLEPLIEICTMKSNKL